MDPLDQERAKIAADAERELTRLWRAWRTIHEMCQDRVCPCSTQSLPNHPAKTLPQGYELAEEEVRISLDDFRERFADASGAPE